MPTLPAPAASTAPATSLAPGAPIPTAVTPAGALARRLPFHVDDHVAVDALCAARPDPRSRACLSLWLYLAVRRSVLSRLLRESAPVRDVDALVGRIFCSVLHDTDRCASAAEYLVRIDMASTVLLDAGSPQVLRALRVIPRVVEPGAGGGRCLLVDQ